MKAVRLLVGMLIFIGLPLVGWGLDNLGGFFADPARSAYVVLVALIQGVAAVWFPESLRESGAGETPVARQRLTVYWLQVASLAIVVGGPWGDRRGWAVLDEPTAVRWGGLGLAVVGFGLMLWARAALGRQFSVQVTIQKEHRLVTDGLYGRVRHPRYAGILLFLAGAALLYRSVPGLVVAAISAGVLGWRIRDEERLLRQRFGDEWDRYCRRSGRLLPRWR